jgi:transcription elongation factor SPT6
VQTIEKLQDEYQFFVLYYGNDIPKMKMTLKAAKKKQKEQQRLEGEDQEMDDEPADDEAEAGLMLKQAPRKSGYTMCVNAGLGNVARSLSYNNTNL